MAKALDPQRLIGRCRCQEHAETYRPQPQNQNMVFYYIDPDHIPQELLCSRCLQKDVVRHGGVIVSDEALRQGIAIFAHYPGWQLTDEQKANAKRRIWPKG
jgi:predicted O-methyltransferase YrrM